MIDVGSTTRRLSLQRQGHSPTGGGSPGHLSWKRNSTQFGDISSPARRYKSVSVCKSSLLRVYTCIPQVNQLYLMLLIFTIIYGLVSNFTGTVCRHNIGTQCQYAGTKCKRAGTIRGHNMHAQHPLLLLAPALHLYLQLLTK